MGRTAVETDTATQSEALTPTQAAALLHRQDALQAEAGAVLTRLNLLQQLRQAGRPELIGSSVLGLMVWRDIDISVVSPGLTIVQAFEAMRPLITRPHVTQVRYINGSGPLNETELPRDERYYFAALYRTEARSEWKIDISFWLADVPRDEPAYLEAIRRRLTDETRLAILWIKEVWHRLPTYRTAVTSMDIYDAVLEHGVRTPSGFDRYLGERGKPGRRP